MNPYKNHLRVRIDKTAGSYVGLYVEINSTVTMQGPIVFNI
jgi:hypothetical protein